VRIDNLTLPDRIDRTVKLGVIGKLGLIGLVGWLWGADAGYELHHQARANTAAIMTRLFRVGS
jgi:hypothetical protein